MISIANPIYDSVFKYLMEDERILHGSVNNRLEEVLSVFDQSHKDKRNRQVLNFEDNAFENDEEMRHILHRLLAAASDSKLRQDMNVEDEYFSAIETRDTAIMLRDQKIAERDAQLAEQNNQIAEQNNQIAEQNNQIAEQNNQIAEQNNQIAEQSNQIAEQSKALLTSAKALKQAGLSIPQIAEMTQLPESIINSL